MKVTEADVIHSSEQELIDTIIADLDWSAIEKLLKEKHQIGLQDDVAFRNGDLVVHGGKVAYKLSFDVKISLDVLFDRNGDCIHLSASGSEEESGESKEEAEEMATTPDIGDRVAEVAPGLADMMEEINADDVSATEGDLSEES